jgi:DNA-binding response OmpR family regulator
MTRVVRGIFESDGIEVLTASSGEEALTTLAEVECVDLVLLDVLLEGMSGIEVCRKIKGNPRWRELPVLMVTGRDAPAERIEGFQVGAADYLTKPFHPPELRARVLVHLRIRQLQREVAEDARLATLLATISSVNHEINNPLTAVMGNAELLVRDLQRKGDEGNVRRAERIVESVERIGSVIHKLRGARAVAEKSYLGPTTILDLEKM